MAEPESTGVVEHLAARALQVRDAVLTAEDLAAARRALIDTLGAAMGGSVLVLRSVRTLRHDTGS